MQSAAPAAPPVTATSGPSSGQAAAGPCLAAVGLEHELGSRPDPIW